MTTPTQVPPSPVPTSQRPVNGAVLSGTALGVYGLATYFGAPTELAVPASIVAGAVLSTVGDVARSQIMEQPPKTFVGKLVLQILARVG